ncbi:hypothetical protein GW17_00051680 [Ensete ventricosum]|nr:hypothetical protein GW17_00051680 [Ensete ventricosum]
MGEVRDGDPRPSCLGLTQHVQHYRGGCQGVRLCRHSAPWAWRHHQLLLLHHCRGPCHPRITSSSSVVAALLSLPAASQPPPSLAASQP